jgi:hypothetical protein
MSSLNLDCWKEIASYLSYIDILTLQSTCQLTSLLILSNFKDIFMSKLMEHHVVPHLKLAKTFCKNLFETNAYVSGGFILDCLYNTNDHHDIDIYDYTNIDNYKSFFSYDDNDIIKNLPFTKKMYDMKFNWIDCDTGEHVKLRKYIHNTYPNAFDIDKHYNNNNGRNRHFNYDYAGLFEKPKFKKKYSDSHKNFIQNCKDLIQIIPIKMNIKNNERSPIPRFIKSSFDLEICQNLFDGQNIHIKNVKKLIYRYDYIKPNTKFILSLYDIEYDNNTQERIEKYRHKGFNIQYHPQFDFIDNKITKTLNTKLYNVPIQYIDEGLIDLSQYDT